MRGFHLRWRRLGALALLPLAPLTATTTIIPGATSARSAETARIDASKPTVRIGGRVILRGAFDGGAHAPVRIELRARGAERWRSITGTRTNADGAYRVRVTPRRSGRWRALLGEPERTLAAESDPAPEGDPMVAGAPRATPGARVEVRSRTRARVARGHLLAGSRGRVHGRVRPAGRRKVVVRVGGRTITTRTGPDGRFAARWRARGTGTYRVRVRSRANRRATGSRSRAGRVTVYRPAPSSWYGPGFYGNRTACGQTLTTSTLGVAHKTMPCGTRLRLRHRGRTVAVRVIDRGPFAGGRELDLTYATKRRLGFGSTGNVLMSR